MNGVCLRSGFIEMQVEPSYICRTPNRANCAPVWSVLLHVVLLLMACRSNHRSGGRDGAGTKFILCN